MPIYWVLMESKPISPGYIMVWIIVKWVACGLEDVDELYRKYQLPLMSNSNRQLQSFYIYREPANAFNGMLSKDIPAPKDLQEQIDKGIAFDTSVWEM